MARLPIGLGNHQHAYDLVEQQEAIIREVSARTPGASPPSLRLESMTQRGRVLRLLNKPDACIEVMQPGLAEARREQTQLTPQVSEFHSQLGRCRVAKGEHRSARQLFERSVALRRESGDRAGEAENLLDLTGLQADAGQMEAAMKGLRAARAQLQREAGGRHPLLVDIQRSLGTLHHARGALDEAEREINASLRDCRNRPSHGWSRSASSGQQHLGPTHPSIGDTERLLGEVNIALGEMKVGIDLLEYAVLHTHVGYGPDHPRTYQAQLAHAVHTARDQSNRDGAFVAMDRSGSRCWRRCVRWAPAWSSCSPKEAS